VSPLTKIVLIEDHDNLRVAMSRLLESNGFTVVALDNAEDFSDTPNTQGAEFFIVDLTLPGEDGLEFVQRLRGSNPQAFIIITTARIEISDRITGYSAGANIYLQKPVEPDELIAIIEAQSGIRQSQFTGPVLNLVSQSISNGTSAVDLSNAETTILQKLTAANDQMLESWQLIALYCDDDKNFNTQNLQMRLSRLRKKLEQIGLGSNAIKSERGIGYRLNALIKVI
jgi:DNA-binding response OmpR family regulator